jgi:putative endonuclease
MTVARARDASRSRAQVARAKEVPDPRRVARERRGRMAETLAAVVLMLCGYRILARRCRTPYGEIDVIARRGNRIAFVEVKARATRAALAWCLDPRQTRRMYDAADFWLGRRRALRDCELGFDAVLVSPWRLPTYQRDALQPAALERAAS